MKAIFGEPYDDESFSRKLSWTSFILSVMIVYTHAINYFVFPLSESIYGRCVYWLEYTMHMLFCSAVPLFYIMSGFMFYRNFDLNKYPAKIKSRFFSLFIPYIFWNFFAYAVMAIASKLPGISSLMSANVDVSLYGMLYATGMGTYNVLWFVRNLMCFVIVSPVLFVVLKNKISGLITLCLLAVSNLIWTGQDVKSLLYTVLFFALGAYLSLNCPQLFRSKISLKGRKASMGLAIMIVLLASVFMLLGTKWRQLLLVIISLGVWYALDAIDFKTVRMPQFVSMSFFVYCSHCLIVETFEDIWMHVFGTNVTSALTDFLLAPIMTLVLVLSVGYIVKNKMPRFYRVIAGGR